MAGIRYRRGYLIPVANGSEHPSSPTTRVGTPATVVFGGIDFSTTEPAVMREQLPNIAEDLGTSVDHDAASNLRVATASSLPVPRPASCRAEWTLSPITAIRRR